MFRKHLTNKFVNKGSLSKIRSDIFHFLEIFICFEKWDGKKILSPNTYTLKKEKMETLKKKKL